MTNMEADEDILIEEKGKENNIELINENYKEGDSIGEEKSFDYEDIEDFNLEKLNLEDLDEEKDDEFQWKVANEPVEHLSNQRQYFAPKALVNQLKSGYEYFALFFDEAIIEEITKQTNIYANDYIKSERETLEKFKHSRINRWKDITSKELKELLAIYIIMGINKFGDCAGM